MFSVQFIQGQRKAGHELGHEVLHLGQIELVDPVPQRALGVKEALVPGLALVYALEVSTDLVGGLDQVPYLAVLLTKEKERLVLGLKLGGQHG